ncbi:unnamed protein product [Clonostachys byssicola]|uniref:FAD-binding PCMH-type domain-containing protein n=1 Tax=Clonostachys byssicola TaxID=160290 RepID=A0A9N9U5X5_9HYPO|nr:unnamed protein product [Clonostachys byssicola]
MELNVFVLLLAVSYYVVARVVDCRTLPGDVGWPSREDWMNLNASVHGRLFSIVPLATVCHGANFDPEQCKALRENWSSYLTHAETAGSVIPPYYQNQTCNPFTTRSSRCEMGNHVSYAIRAGSAKDIASGIKFARDRNVRLVIRNTGHDFLGKSIGRGGLAIWTRDLNKAEFIPSYRSALYEGPAMKLGAGIRAFEAVEAAHSNKVRLITGYCSTVGIVGGFLQGGGSGPLSSVYGLAADQVLEYEVVTASGEVVTASPFEHKELYWALSGGGGGTFGIVVSATVRVFEDGRMGGAKLRFSRNNVESDTVYDLLGSLLDLSPMLAEAGLQFAFQITPAAFEITPISAPGLSSDALSKLLEPFVSRLDQEGIDYSYQVSTLPDYKSFYEIYLGPTPEGPYRANVQVGSRFVPRTSLETHRTKIIEATRNITENTPVYIVFHVANVTQTSVKKPVSDNAVLPQWRQTIIHAMAVLAWDFEIAQTEMLSKQAELTESVIPQLRAALPPDSGTYLNEAEVGISTWKEDFFGDNYEKLRQVKYKYDPEDLFYASTAVGSDAWWVASDGRLCRANPSNVLRFREL